MKGRYCFSPGSSHTYSQPYLYFPGLKARQFPFWLHYNWACRQNNYNQYSQLKVPTKSPISPNHPQSLAHLIKLRRVWDFKGMQQTANGVTGFPLGVMKKFWAGQWWWLHNTVNVLKATELHTLKWLKWSTIRYCILPIQSARFKRLRPWDTSWQILPLLVPFSPGPMWAGEWRVNKCGWQHSAGGLGHGTCIRLHFPFHCHTVDPWKLTNH